MKINHLLLLAVLAVSTLAGCKKDDEPEPDDESYTVPTTYNFSGADYSESSNRLTMMQKIDSVTNNGRTGVVDPAVLKNMFTNSGNPFLQSSLNTSGIQIKNKAVLEAQTEFEKFMDSVGMNSAFPVVTFAPGTAGVATAGNGTSKYLLNEYGIEYRQVLSKAFMGAVQLNNIQILLSSSSIGTSVTKATKQHNWDLAFGYFGVPVDFPTVTTGARYIGSYCNQMNAVIGSNATIMNAFLKGRAAIDNDDQATVDAQAVIIREKLEEVIAAAAIHYMNEVQKANVVTDIAQRSHALGEGIGFIYALKYAGLKISDSQVSVLLGFIGTNVNNIDTRLSDLNNVKDYLSSIYGLDAVKDIL